MIAKRINHKGNCQHAQTPAARRACRKALLAAATKENTMTFTGSELRDIAAKAIARARTTYGRGAAAFDYLIAAQGVGGQYGEIGNEIYLIARELWPAVTTDECADRAAQLRTALAGELGAYEARCKSREYTGWSRFSAGPIRYAN